MGTFSKSPKLQVLFVIACLFSPCISLKIGETCSKDTDCDAGLSCQTCAANGNTRPRCTRIQPTNPTSKVKGLPFNNYTWLTTHNSYAQAGVRSSTGSLIIAPMNQNDTVTSQLKGRLDSEAKAAKKGNIQNVFLNNEKFKVKHVGLLVIIDANV